MAVLRLGDVDRERWGGPEWLDVPESLPIRDVKALEAAGGKYTDWFLRDTAQGFAVTVWMCLYKAGVTIETVEELDDLDMSAIRLASVDPGKAQSSASGSGRTPRTSRSSSTSRRKTSTTSN